MPQLPAAMIRKKVTMSMTKLLTSINRILQVGQNAGQMVLTIGAPKYEIFFDTTSHIPQWVWVESGELKPL